MKEALEKHQTKIFTSLIFEVEPQHLKILNRMVIQSNKNHVFQDIVRPYGNSDIVRDIGEILNIPPDKKDGKFEYYSDNLELYFLKYHIDMKTCLDILLHNLSIEVGIYHRNSMLDTDYKKLV